MDRVMRNAPYLLLAGALGASAVLILALTAPLTFFGDSWSVLMERRELTLDTVLAPHNEHIIAVPVLLSNLSLSVFGMESPQPEQVVLTICLLATACLLFVYTARRTGPWLALFGASLLLFLGPAWEAMLWPFEVGFAGSVLFGVAMLLALDREDRRGDIVACACLTGAVVCSSLGIPFVVAEAVDLLQRRRDRDPLPRLFVLAIPLLVFAAWYLGWGSDAETHISLRNVLSSPRFVAEMVAFAVAGMVGLGTSPYDAAPNPGWGYALLILLAVGLVLRQTRKPGLPVGFWVVASAAATGWFLTAFNQTPGREPTTSRYVYASAVFLLLMGANALRGTRFGPRALVAIGAVTLAAVSVNAIVLKDGQSWFRDQTVLTRSDLAAIEIARSSVSPDFWLSPEIAGTPSLINITAGEYLEAVEEHGSPAYSGEELSVASETGRRQADIVLASALPLSTETFEGPAPLGQSCGAMAIGEAPAGPGMQLPRGVTRIEVSPGPSVTLGLRRFAAEEFPVPLRELPGGSTMLLTIPDDASRVPWRLEVSAQQPVTACEQRAG